MCHAGPQYLYSGIIDSEALFCETNRRLLFAVGRIAHGQGRVYRS